MKINKNVKLLIMMSLIFIFFSITFVINANPITIIDMQNVRWSSTTFVYDGKIKEVKLENIPDNFPSDIKIKYIDNKALDVGVYHAEVEFDYDDDVYHLSNIMFQNKKEWIIRNRSIISSDGIVTIESDYGIHPNHIVEIEMLNIVEFIGIDVSVAGAYQEVKGAFTIKLLNDGVQTVPDDFITIKFKIPDELLNVTDLQIYDYSMDRLTSVDSENENGMLIFDTRYLSDTYLIVGVRSTYTNNEIWKVFLILSIVGLGIFGISIGIVVKKKKNAIVQDKGLYRRSGIR